MALNFKGIEYTTEWVEYPDIASRLKPHVTPNSSDQNPVPYSIPTVQFPSGDYLMDSASIAERIEQDHPTPSMYLDAPVLAEVVKIVPKVQGALRPEWMADVPEKLLNPPSAEYFSTTREKRYGKPLAQLKKEQGGEEAWIAALPELKRLANMIGNPFNGQEGPFCMGAIPSYADFVIVSLLHFFKVIDQDIYDRIVTIDKRFNRLYKASEKWLERDDH